MHARVFRLAFGKALSTLSAASPLTCRAAIRYLDCKPHRIIYQYISRQAYIWIFVLTAANAQDKFWTKSFVLRFQPPAPNRSVETRYRIYLRPICLSDSTPRGICLASSGDGDCKPPSASSRTPCQEQPFSEGSIPKLCIRCRNATEA